MKVSSIIFKWAPSPVPDTGDYIDWFKAKGQLLRSGNVVMELPETDVTIQVGPAATRAPSSFEPWKFTQEVEADTLTLDLYDSEWAHSVEIDGIVAELLDVKHAEWAYYTITPPKPKPGQMLANWLPMLPWNGPPLPQFLGVYWPTLR